MSEKDVKKRKDGSAATRATKMHHGGDVESYRDDIYSAEQAGVNVDRDHRDIRAVGMGPSDMVPEEPDRGKEFSGPGRRRDPDDAG